MRRIIFLFFITLFIPGSVFGAAIKFQNSASGRVDVLLDTEGDAINVVDVNLKFDPEIFGIASLGDGNSAVNFWITKPTFSNDNGSVSFSGMIPGGIMGSAIKLIDLDFSKASASGGKFNVSGNAYLNDGSGKSIPLREDIFINPGSATSPNLNDKTSPEDFTPELVQNDSLYEGKWTLVFSTTDKGAGVVRYEVKENSLVLGGSEFTSSSAESPYLLNDQKLESDIYVRAIDQAGNIREVVFAAKNKPLWNKGSAVILFGLLLLLIVAAYALLRRKHK